MPTTCERKPGVRTRDAREEQESLAQSVGRYGADLKIHLSRLLAIQVPGFAEDVSPGDMFAGYKRYQFADGANRRNGVAWCGTSCKIAWRKEAAQALARDQASCFYRSLAWVVTQVHWDQVSAAVMGTAAGFQAGFTAGMASAFFALLGLPYQVSVVQVDGTIAHLYQPPPGSTVVRRGVLWVPLNDAGLWAPHWLPYTNLHEQATVAIKGTEYREYLVNDELRPGIPHVWEAYVRDRLVEVLRADQQANFHRAAHPEAVFTFYGAVSSRSIPYDVSALGVASSCRVQTGTMATYWTPILWTDSKDINTLGLEVRPGRPGCLARALAHVGQPRGIMWEFSPTVLAGAEISVGDYAFVEKHSPRHPKFRHLNVAGQYMPEAVSAIRTAGGSSLGLTNERTITAHGVKYLVYDWVFVTVATLWSAAVHKIELRTSKIACVHTMNPDEPLPTPKSFPTRDAWVRIMYDRLAKLVSPECVGSLMTARNEELALPGGSGADPVEVARAIEVIRRELERTWAVEGKTALPFEIVL